MKKTQKQIILETIIDLHNKDTPASRITVAKMTGIKQTVVDYYLKELADDGVIYRVCNGVYAPAFQHPPSRTIYKSILPDGTVKIDIGDDVLTLTPKEARTLGGLMFAEATEYGSLALTHRLLEQENAFHNRLKRLEKELKGYRSVQADLL